MFDQVVFAGGGHRCWWQAGFWEQVEAQIQLRPKVIAGVSAGAATACLVQCGKTQEALAYYDDVLKTDQRNVYWSRLFKKGQRALPHDTIYRQALSHFFKDAQLSYLKQFAPQIKVSYALVPMWAGPVSATAAGMLVYNLEKRLFAPLHPTWGRAIGFRPSVTSVQSCHDAADLVELLMASACTPPLTQVMRREGQLVFDGGMIDNVPVSEVDANVSTLVLLSRRYAKHAPVFLREGRVYAQPSQTPAASSWDYTKPHSYRTTYEQGRADGLAFLSSVGRANLVGSALPKSNPVLGASGPSAFGHSI